MCWCSLGAKKVELKQPPIPTTGGWLLNSPSRRMGDGQRSNAFATPPNIDRMLNQSPASALKNGTVFVSPLGRQTPGVSAFQPPACRPTPALHKPQHAPAVSAAAAVPSDRRPPSTAGHTAASAVQAEYPKPDRHLHDALPVQGQGGVRNTMATARMGESLVQYQNPGRDLNLINSRINSLAASVVRHLPAAA